MLLYWAICAPAAHLGSGSRLSGSLSGIKPKFSVTRCRHCGPLHHSPELIGQKFVRSSMLWPEATTLPAPVSQGGTSLSQPKNTLPLTWRWSSQRLGAIHHLWESQWTSHRVSAVLCHGRPMRTCISHQVLEDVPLGTTQVPATLYHVNDC